MTEPTSLDEDERGAREGAGLDLALEGIGLTLIGVIVSMGLTVGLGVQGQWWVRVLCGAATSIGFTAIVKLAHSRASVLKRFADWLTH